jgi:N-acetylglucosamine-6-phosphate deacetylase
MIGIHLEGPYLNPLRSGTHDTPFLRGTDVGEFRKLAALSENRLCRITIAPEMDPGLKVVREAAERGIQVSLGHSDATEEQTIAAIDAGATHITHTGNAMRPFHQREPGIFGVALTDDRVFTEIIADGVHLHATTLQLLLASKGVDRTLLVTDGLSAVGMPDGNYPLGDKTVTVRGGECRDEKGRLAGSTLTLDRAVRNLVEWLDVPLHEALTAASATPARSMRMGDSIGMIRPGADADLIFLSRDLVVLHTMVAGRTVYSRAFSDFQTQTSDRKT